MATFPLTLTQLIGNLLPAGFSVSEDFVTRSVNTWQLFLWGVFKDVVAEEDKYDIRKYPENALPLFAALVVRDVLTVALTGSFLDNMGAAGNAVGAEAQGSTKRITTGPTEVEFHDGLSALAKLIAATKNGLGILADINEKACMFAQQLGIKLPFCESTHKGLVIKKMGVRVPNIPRKILRR